MFKLDDKVKIIHKEDDKSQESKSITQKSHINKKIDGSINMPVKINKLRGRGENVKS